ncbi:MAG: TonB-dependent receptor [Alphaproteobacteria bacterium HGW-Alphaproteobacteria-14]|nr:MAG: TonB-dependent receptor [Alphaproteobacteria bacterium HGW-Alphaproteobacteria-14]
MKKRFGSSTIALAVACLAQPAMAQDAKPAGDQAAEESTNIIMVTGSRIGRERQSASVPIVSVQAQDLQLAGTINSEDLLNTLPQFVPATTSASNSLASATGTGAATLDLRGLGASRNLVLVNGRRYVFFDATQVTNINAIPAALIERVEVVTGGASAVYGSDAIAGVVNYILRDDFEGVEARGQYNLDSRGDGGIVDVTLTAGTNFGGDRGNITVSANYADRKAIGTEDRAFSSQVLTDVTVNGVRQLGPGGSSFVPNGRFTGLPTSATAIGAIPGLAAAYAAAGLTGIGANGFIPDDSGLNVRPYVGPNAAGANDAFDFLVDNFLRFPQERWGLTTIGHYDLNDNVTAFFEGAFTNNKTTLGFASSFVSATLPVEVSNPFLGAPLQNVLQLIDQNETGAAANDGLVNLGFNRRLSEVGPRRNFDDRDAWRVLVGLRGDIAGGENVLSDLSWETYYSYARSKNTQLQVGNVSLSKFRQGILSGPGGAAPVVNPFGPNISQAGIDFISVESTNIDITDLHVAAANLSGNLFTLPAGPVGFSVGSEYRSSSVDFRPDALLAAGDIAGFNPITATKGSIDVWELFGEVRVPLLTDVAFARELAVNAAFRYSDYDLEQVGGVWTYQGGIDWQVSSDIAFGGQYQRAIRAPNVGEAFGGTRTFPVAATDPCALASAATNTVVRDLCIGTGVPAALVGNAAVQPNAQIPGVLGGNPNLNEEKSDTYTAGVILTPSFVPNLRLSVDYYSIKLTGAIAPLAGGVNSILDLCFNQIRNLDSVACQAVTRNPANGTIDTNFPVTALNQNIGRIETSGIDVQVNYRIPTGNGSRLDLSFAGSWVDEFTVTPVEDLPANRNFCIGLFGPTCGEPKFAFKTTSRATWSTDRLSLSVRHRWIDAVTLEDLELANRRGGTSPDPSTVAVPRIKAHNYVDLSFTYDLNEAINLWGGVNNVLDQGPPLLGTRQERNNTWPDTYDSIGTEFFVGVSAKF